MLAVPETPTVFIVDDDSAVCDALALLLKIDGFASREFADALQFLDVVQTASPACVILDLYLPGLSGLDVLRALSARNFAPPVIVISGQSDIATAVAAIKAGATDFIEKPFSGQAMLERIRDAIAAYQETLDGRIDGLADFPGRALLTNRERQVLAQVACGASNKEAGRRLGISPRTIEVHRARIMEKLCAKNAADLMRIVLSEKRSGRLPVGARL